MCCDLHSFLLALRCAPHSGVWLRATRLIGFACFRLVGRLTFLWVWRCEQYQRICFWRKDPPFSTCMRFRLHYGQYRARRSKQLGLRGRYASHTNHPRCLPWPQRGNNAIFSQYAICPFWSCYADGFQDMCSLLIARSRRFARPEGPLFRSSAWPNFSRFFS